MNPADASGNADANAAPPTNPTTIDADLAAVVGAWGTLPDALRAGILAMVRAAKE
jgi:hypothetical protein